MMAREKAAYDNKIREQRCKDSEELEQLRAIVAELPKCNRLNDDKTALELECPVVPGMKQWLIGDRRDIYEVTADVVDTTHARVYSVPGATWRWRHDVAYNSLKAAIFAKEQADE